MSDDVPGPRRHPPLDGDASYGEEAGHVSDGAKPDRASDTITGGDNNMTLFDDIEDAVDEMDDLARDEVDDMQDVAEYLVDEHKDTVEDLETVTQDAVDTEAYVQQVKSGLEGFFDGVEDVFDQYEQRVDDYSDRADDAMDRLGY
jgi:ElaB/YqjD/DUF883 family membrane-anchored ribosome-binding protein